MFTTRIRKPDRRNYDWIYRFLWRICVSEFLCLDGLSLSRPKRGNRTRQPGAISDSNDNLTEYYTFIVLDNGLCFWYILLHHSSIIIITPRRIKFSEWPDGTSQKPVRTMVKIFVPGWYGKGNRAWIDTHKAECLSYNRQGHYYNC